MQLQFAYYPTVTGWGPSPYPEIGVYGPELRVFKVRTGLRECLGAQAFSHTL